MIITCVCCTYGRHSLLERAVRCFLDQDLKDRHWLLIYNNAPQLLSLDNFYIPENKGIILINNDKDLLTGNNYTNVGAIFRDALHGLPAETSVITFFDDDDLFLPNHLSEGMKGMKKAHSQNKRAYKPYYSYFKYQTKINLEHNTMEPSIFVDLAYVKEKGFKNGIGDYHQGWEQPLKKEDKILIDKQGIPTFMYDWSGDNGSWKISGGPNDDIHFKTHHKNSSDFGDSIITPITTDKINQYYKLVK